MSTCESSYPAELPLGCVQQLLTIIRGGKVEENIQEFSAAAWSVAGYCLKVFVGEPAPVVNGLPPPQLTPAEQAELVELSELLRARSAATVVGPLAEFLQLIVVPVLIGALNKLFDSLGE